MKMRKTIVIFLTAAICMSSVLPAAASAETAADDALKLTDMEGVITAADYADMDVLYYYPCDESIYDGSFDSYFEGGAETGLEALLDSGNVYANGMPLPSSPEEFELNGEEGISQLENGNWAWRSVPWSDYTGEREGEFVEARKNFLDDLTTYRGMTAVILAEEGHDFADAVAITIVASGLVDEITENEDDTVTIDMDGTEVTADTDKYDSSIEIGDIAVYWTESDGMHIERALSETAVYHYEIGEPDAEAYETDTIDGKSYIDARMDRSIGDGSKPNQFARALKRLGLQDTDIIGWWTADTHYLIAFTRDTEGARSILESAIENAESGTEGIAISEDGSDVDEETYWVNQEVWDEYQTVLTSAKEMLEDETANSIQLDQMISDLADAYGSETASGDHMSGPKGVLGSMEPGSQN